MTEIAKRHGIDLISSALQFSAFTFCSFCRDACNTYPYQPKANVKGNAGENTTGIIGKELGREETDFGKSSPGLPQ